MTLKAIPEGYTTITPYLVVKDADKLIDLLQKAINAAIIYRSVLHGVTNHAEIQIGNSRVMMGKARNENEVMPAMLYVYTIDTDKLYHKALEHGAISIMEPADQFYGDRNAGVRDPEGNSWWIATHMEDVSEDEMEKRMKEMKG